MSSILVMTAAREHAASPTATTVAAKSTRWWVAYITWRIEQTAIAQLSSMSDRELKDIGLSRSQIEAAARNSVDRMRDRGMLHHV